MPRPKTHATLPSPVLQALPPIPAQIDTRDEFLVEATGQSWQLPPQVGGGLMNFADFLASPDLLAVIQSYLADLLGSLSISHSHNEYKRLKAIDWTPLNASLQRDGALGKADLLGARLDLENRFPDAWSDYWPALRRLYVYAANLGVPGFDRGEALALRRIKYRGKPSIKVILRVAPGARRSEVSKNRNYYDDATMVEIEKSLFRANRLRRQGDLGIKLSALVLTWLAMDYGQRPLTYAKLRESHFLVEATERAKAYFLRLPVCKWRHRLYISETRLRPLNLLVGMLLEELIVENRAARTASGLDSGLDWPLFPLAYGGRGAQQREAAHVPNTDPSLVHHQSSTTLNNKLLKPLFEILQVPDGRGGILVPTFSSFRDTYETNLERRGVPLEERAEAMGQRTTKTTDRYGRRGVEFVADLDAKCGEAHLALVAPFLHLPLATPEDAGEDIPFIDPDTGILLGKHGRCGCPGSPCGMSGSVECYVCEAFRALEDGPHGRILNWMLKKREELTAKGYPERQWRRYDGPILLCSLWIERIDNLREGRTA